jgi:ketosteroid isomerase-like protein
MSQENVEIVRASFETWNTGDMGAFRELHDPDVILGMDASWPEPGAVLRQGGGHARVRAVAPDVGRRRRRTDR